MQVGLGMYEIQNHTEFCIEAQNLQCPCLFSYGSHVLFFSEPIHFLLSNKAPPHEKIFLYFTAIGGVCIVFSMVFIAKSFYSLPLVIFLQCLNQKIRALWCFISVLM